MPTHKDLKRLVRRRMQKTGESYTAARAQLVKSNAPASKSHAPVRPSDYAALAGKSDAAVKAATGCTWERWVDALDYVNADTWPHPKIARYIQEKFKLTSWWAQTVTVGYERIRGLREVGQKRSGSFGFTKSRTFPVPIARLFAAFAVARARSRWMPGVKLTVRTATPHRSMRFTWEDETSIEVSFMAKGPGKSSAHVQHDKLPTREASVRAKAFWTGRLDALGALLTPEDN
jgi:hypothetical protein